MCNRTEAERRSIPFRLLAETTRTGSVIADQRLTITAHQRLSVFYLFVWLMHLIKIADLWLFSFDHAPIEKTNLSAHPPGAAVMDSATAGLLQQLHCTVRLSARYTNCWCNKMRYWTTGDQQCYFRYGFYFRTICDFCSRYSHLRSQDLWVGVVMSWLPLIS